MVNPTAFFFQGASLLLPAEIAGGQMDCGLDLDFLNAFEAPPEVFAIPALDRAGETITCVSVPPETSLPPRWRAVPVRQALSLLCDSGGFDPAAPSPSIYRLFRAFHIAQWRRESRFCGSCGAENGDADGELARRCPACGRLEFPRIAPAVITIVVNDEGKALLAHNSKFAPGVYSLIAGFVEAGESLEQTVAREIREEAHIEVTNIRYAASQPWPFPHSLMLGFSARYASGQIRPDGVEIADARWFGPDDLPTLPGSGSVSRYLIGRWLDGTL
jgi:NAD+ diphosphatase